MKMTKRELTQIIREVINEEADTISLKTLIDGRVEKLSPNDLRYLTTPLSQGGNPAEIEAGVEKILKKVAATATPGGIRNAMRKFDDLYAKIMGPLDDPDYGFTLLPASKVKAAAKKLVLRLAYIAVGM